jgi:putative transposase
VFLLKMPDRLMEAGFRFRVIGPLTDPNASKSELKVWRRAIVRQTHEHPTRGWVKVSTRSVRRWLGQYRQGRMDGLMPAVREQTGPRHLTEAAFKRLEEIIQENPLRNTLSLLEDLAAEFPDLAGKVAPSTLNRHLHTRGVCRLLHPDRVATPPFKAFETLVPNELWHSDVHYGPDAYDDNGKLVSTRIICWLDGCSRVCCHCQAYSKDDFLALMRALQPALQKFGIPRGTYADHGSIYSGLQFALVCGDLGIIPLQTAVKSPWQNGKQERLWGTAESDFFSEVRLLPPLPLKRLNEHLRAWVEGTYHVRIHSVTKQAPLERWKALKPADHREPTEDQLKRLFWFWERRTVSTTGIVQLFSNRYFADPQLATQRVIVRYNPEDLACVQIWSRGRDHKLLCEATANPLLVRRRENPPPPPDTQPKQPSAAAQRRLDAIDARYRAVLAREAGLIQFNTKEEP